MLDRPDLKAWVEGKEFELEQWAKQIEEKARKELPKLNRILIKFIEQRLEKTKSKDERIFLKKWLSELKKLPR